MYIKIFGISFRNMLKTGIVLEDCCGCGACVQMCPKGALQMVFNEDGFPIPSLDSAKCIDCKLCEKVCPINEEAKKNLLFKTFLTKIKRWNIPSHGRRIFSSDFFNF